MNRGGIQRILAVLNPKEARSLLKRLLTKARNAEQLGSGGKRPMRLTPPDNRFRET